MPGGSSEIREGGSVALAYGSVQESSSASGSKGSAAISLPAFLSRISTLPSACSRYFWQSRESCTPSSNNFMASSSERFAPSSFPTISSRRVSEHSKSGFFAASDFFAGVGFKDANFPSLVPSSPISSGGQRQHSNARARSETTAL